MSPYNFSSSSNFPTQASALNWALVAGQTVHSSGQTPAEVICFPFLPQCKRAVTQKSVSKQPEFWGHPCTHAAAHKHLTYGPPSSQHRAQRPAQNFPHGCLFPKTHYFALQDGPPIVGLKIGPTHRGQGETEERGGQLFLALISKKIYLQGLSWAAKR